MSDDLERADIVAFLEAHLRGDEQAINYLIKQLGLYPLFAGVVGLLIELAGEDTVREYLAGWRGAGGLS
jgi:hypothetical protein